MADRAGEDPVVTVVIPVLNGERVLPRCLDALAGQIDAPSFEVVVVDNGSSDRSPELAATHHVGARVLYEATRGPYAARNTGVGKARGSIVALTDADCVPSPRWLAAGVDAISAGADLVGGAIRQRPTGPHPSIWERYDRATYLRQDHFVAVDHFAATANLFVRMSVITAIGAFRPELVASGDLEFGRRATEWGHRLVFSAEASVDHEPRTTLRATWTLHRKLGSGFAELARAGLWDSPWRDPSLRIGLPEVAELVALDGPPIRRRYLAPVHLVAMGARWTGSLTRRG